MDVQNRVTAIDLSELPFELIIEILLRVPAEPLVRLKCVSKSWYGLINTPNFIKLHVSQSLQASSNKTLIILADSSLYTVHFQGLHYHATKLYNPEYIDLRLNLLQSDKLVGSCNGLLCFCYYQVVLYNPLTRFRKILPRFHLRTMFLDRKFCIHGLGFAYDSISDDYKVLMCMKSQYENIYWESVLYSCKANAWEIIANPPWGWSSVISPSVVVNNSLHWMDCYFKQIRCFDLVTQRFSEIPLPKEVIPGHKPILADLRQQLCIVTCYLDIWMLKEYGMDDSWTRFFRCPFMEWRNNLYDCTSLARWGKDLSLLCSEDGRKVLVAVPNRRENLICCDLVSHEVRKIEIEGLPYLCSSIVSWMPSLATA